MAFWIGEFVGGFVAAIFVPLFLFYFADRKGFRPRTAVILRSVAVLVAVLVACAAAAGASGRFPAGAVLAVAVCFAWAVRSTMRQRGAHLNGWQRLGLIASVLWVPIGFFWAVSSYVSVQTAPVSSIYTLCLHVADQQEQLRASEWLERHWPPSSAQNIRQDSTLQSDYQKCSSDADRQYSEAIAGRWWVALAGAVLPLFLVWGLAWISAGIFRWVRAGFVRQRA